MLNFNLQKLLLAQIFCLAVASPASLFADPEISEYPAHWPWRAVTMEEMGGQTDRLKFLKDELNIDAVLLYLQPRHMAARKSITGEEALLQSMAWTDRMLDECEKLKIFAIINLNSFPLDPQRKYNQTDNQFWSSKQNLDDVVSTVDRLVKHFSGRGDELAGYQFISEPLVTLHGKKKVPVLWRTLLERNIQAIRRHDKNRWIVVDAGPGGLSSGYKEFDKIKDTRIIYDAHMYSPHLFTHQGIKGWPSGGQYPSLTQFRSVNKEYLKHTLKDVRKYQLRHKIPVLIGEFSVVRWASGGEQYIQDLADIFNEYGWAWSYHSGSGWHGWNPDYNQNYPGEDTDEKKWKNDYVGLNSVRWKTLKKIFKR